MNFKINQRKMKVVIVICFQLFALISYAQSSYSKYSWNTMPVSNQADTMKAVDGAVILLERRITDIYVNKQRNFEETFIFHKKIKVETDKAINRFNKIYISLNNVLEIVDMAARFILPDGKETIVSKNNIKQIENLENVGDVKTFVIEGAEAGGQIEYYYILRKEFNPYGGFYVQDETPRANVEVIFAYPKKLAYIFRLNNGFPEFEEDDTDSEITVKRATITNVEGITEERYAYYKPNLMSFDYTLAYNRYQSSLRVYSWAKACNNIYNNSYIFTKKETAAAKTLLKQINLSERDELQRIRDIENWVKKNFKVDKHLQKQTDLAKNIKLKQCNFYDVTRLYIALFQEAGITFEMVKTGDNSEQPFRPDFDAFNYLDYTLFYFPNVNEYITPEDNAYRVGILPSEFQGGYGIFMKPIAYNEMLKTLGYEIRKIPVHECKLNGDSMFVSITIEPENNILKAKTRRVMFGDFARSFQSYLHLLDDTKKRELVESVFSLGKDQTEVLSMNYQNSAPENIALKPLIWDMELQTKSLIEEAGTDLLIKIGETIGRQIELYQKEERKLPIVVGILHDYYREIKFAIPDGYKIANLNDLNMHIEMKNDGKTSCIFTSEASLQQNVLTIISKEYYLDSGYPASRYDEFRSVINAAADFNKKTVLLQKI